MIKDLKNENWILRGKVGELIAQEYIKNSFRTTDASKGLLLYLLKNNFIKKEQMDFLTKNWKSIDLFSFEGGYGSPIQNLTIYEIKTKKFYDGNLDKIYYLWRISKNLADVFKEAGNLGIKVKIGEIKLFDDWRYSFDLKDFKFDDACIDNRRNHREYLENRKK